MTQPSGNSPITEILKPWIDFIHSEYDGTNQLDDQLAEVTKAEAALKAWLDTEINRAILETWNYTGEGYNGEYTGLTHNRGKRYTIEEVETKVLEEVRHRLGLTSYKRYDI